ncbi:protein scabrous [Drosophila montana]|uniref:protein scabrous n=1 Tax=Drosophila montana TaxID=40370 RepID=UPI00313EDE4D
MLRLILLIVSLAVASARGATSGVISDVNNMLRDAKASSSAPVAAAAATLPPSSVELLRFVDDEDNEEGLEMLSNGVQLGGNKGQDEEQDVPHNLKLGDQVRLLTKQLNALMMRRREDYELLEHNLRKSLRLTTDAASVDADMRSELDQLRREMQTLRATHSGNKERLTVEWLQQSISEIRKQLVELQRTAANVAKDVRHEGTAYEDLATIRNDYQQLKLELAAQRERQQQTEVIVQELREELLQQEQEYKHELNRQLNAKANAKANTNANAIVKQQTLEQSASIEENSSSQEASQESRSMSSSELADHRRRHCRFQQQQIHSLQLAQRSLRRQVNELKYHHIDERVRSIELEQHRIANANFNLSRQIATLDKLHTSMLELLEDVEGLQSKMDKSIPELRHEISKLEFANAQISSEQNLVREENKNAARSLQAMAVSVSVLQDEREGVKKLVSNVEQLQTNVDRIQSLVNDELHNKLSHLNKPHKRPHHQKPQQPQELTDLRTDNELAETLVAELENVEAQYEAIVNKLPQDCSELSTQVDGLHLIAPAGQHHPLMTHCNADGWTTVQRRFDGSADFNRSWADYAQGFGTPGGEYWIGNEQLHHLTLNNCTQLRVHMQDIYDNNWVAEYKHFYISSRSDGYRLHIGEYSGNASDALNYQQGMQFSAIDDDRDISQTHCAANYEGGWWFSHCQHANLNGRYNLGLTWFDAGRNEWIAVRSSQMLVKRRPSDECAPSNGNEAPTGAAAATTIKSASAGTTPTIKTITTTVVPSTRPNTVVQFVAAAQA